MLAIVNVTKDDTQKLDDYEIRVNKRVIGRFKHERYYNGAAQCLRDAADALDKDKLDENNHLLKSILPMFLRVNKNEYK